MKKNKNLATAIVFCDLVSLTVLAGCNRREAFETVNALHYSLRFKLFYSMNKNTSID
jgi:hypothetical protein